MIFFSSFFLVTILFLGMVTLPKTFFKKYSLLIFILGFGIRILCIFLPPFWEDDWSRYLWEGNLIRNGESPYQIAPSAYFQKQNISETEIEILSQINHPDWTTIYSPFVLLFFALFSPGFSGIFLKLSYLFLETASILFFSKKKFNKQLLLYWSFPVLIKEVYLNFHFEILVLSLAFVSFQFIREKKRILASFLLGLGVHIKIFSLFYSFYLITTMKLQNWKTQVIPWILNALSFFLGFFIFFFIYYLLFPNTIDFGTTNLLKFGANFKFNQFYEPFWRLFGVIDLKVFPFLIHFVMMTVYVFLSLEKQNRIQKFRRFFIHYNLYFVYSYLFLSLLPVSNPWYFLVLVPLLLISPFPSIIPWILVSVPQLSYLTKVRLGQEFTYFYEIPDPILLVEALISIFCLSWYFIQIFILLYKLSNISNIAPKGSIGYGNRN
ncbi:hypothetical protein [Leptospira meyeri]|uniref:hypothetical protein n=1 Tax=Leptospira meyeri TaxID=29508 RepID=UPI0014386D06|nr:hypothetical protein [Leptospira meyeri]